MTPDLSLLSGFARGLLLSLHVRDTCLHSGSWLLSGLESPYLEGISSRGLGHSLKQYVQRYPMSWVLLKSYVYSASCNGCQAYRKAQRIYRDKKGIAGAASEV